MARTGVTQEQINEAAETLLRQGERPTIERVRAKLGTGSPNTLIRLLDVWWSELGQRLAAKDLKVLLPDAPLSVVEAASILWTTALDEANAKAESRIVESLAAIDAERVGLVEREQELNEKLYLATSEAEASRELESKAATRLQDLQRLAEQQRDQLADLVMQRDSATSDRDEALKSLSEAKDIASGRAALAMEEQANLEQRHRGAQDRWMREVDRARQETAQITTQLKRAERDARAASDTAVGERTRLLEELRNAQRSQDLYVSKLSALEDEVRRLHDQLGVRLKANSRPKKASPKPVQRSRRQVSSGKVTAASGDSQPRRAKPSVRKRVMDSDVAAVAGAPRRR